MKYFLILFLVTFSTQLLAQDFVYTPKNPAFGGQTFNYQWMLSSAQAQNTTKAPENDLYSAQQIQDRDPMKDFSESLNRQILSRLSREIVDRQFGEDALAEGQYELGNYTIDIGNGEGGINISIVDLTTGATTDVNVPHF